MEGFWDQWVVAAGRGAAGQGPREDSMRAAEQGPSGDRGRASGGQQSRKGCIREAGCSRKAEDMHQWVAGHLEGS